jgi:putative phage-type endonuclease
MEQAQWLEERRKGIGGSDVAAIMGLSPWKTAYQVYREKRKEVEDWAGNELTDWGKRMEPAIRQWYSDTTGRDVRLPDKILYHPAHPFMLASLDGFTDDGRVVEIKTGRSGKGWGEPETNQVPDYYALQVHHYMTVTGFQVADIPVSIAGSSPSLYIVEADKEISEMIIEACAKFWERVVNGNPPDPVTYADAVDRFGSLKAAGAIIAGENEIHAVDGIKSVRTQIKELEEYEEAWKARIIIAMGETADTLVDSAGSALVTYKLSNGRKTFDAKTFGKDHPDLYQQYLKNGEPQRRFLVK